MVTNALKSRCEDGGKRRLLAFTLVELLVVVSIIALLISILLPSLKKARDQAKTVKCQATTVGLGKGATTYATEENEWLVGSPGTTGSALLGSYASRATDDELIPTAPVQIFDWAGPVAAYSMGMKGLPDNRADRWRVLVEDAFECAANKLLSEPYFGGAVGNHGQFRAQRMVSYNTVRNFMYWEGGGPFGEADWPLSVAATLPSGYSPRVDRIGQPSEKVFFTDSSRYTDDEGKIDHDLSWRAGYGGAFSTGGPTLPYVVGDSDRSYLRSFLFEDPVRKYSYRHSRGKDVGIVVTFFDGHSSWMSEHESRNPNFWWPKGTWIPKNQLNMAARKWIGRNDWVANKYKIQR